MRNIAEKDDLSRRLNDYQVYKNILEQNLFKNNVILKAMRSSLKHLKIRLSFGENEDKLLHETNEELMRKYGAQCPVAGKSEGKLVK